MQRQHLAKKGPQSDKEREGKRERNRERGKSEGWVPGFSDLAKL